MRRLSVMSGVPLNHILVDWLVLAGIDEPALRELAESTMNTSVSIGAQGRRDLIKMEEVSKGGRSTENIDKKQPGILARNIWDRSWRRKAEQEAESK